MLKSGELPLHAFLEDLCRRVELYDPTLQTLLPEADRRKRIFEEAQALLEQYPEPESRPPLFGIPVGVKDIFRVDGFPTKAGSRLPKEQFDGEESWVVSTLRRNGALILGKTVTTEFAFVEPGPTRNPHNPAHSPGGSSSGSAAAVAAGFAPCALGTQTIGSVLRPAAFCGVIGFKPSQGRIPTSGIIPFSPTVDHVGFFVQDPEGLQIASRVLIPDWNNNNLQPVSTLKIAATAGEYLKQADEEIRQWFTKVVSKMKGAGIEVFEWDCFGEITEMNKLHRAIIARDFARVHQGWFDRFEKLYSTHSRNLIMEGRAVPEELYHQAVAAREDCRSHLKKTMLEHGIDVWISPAATSLAPKGIGSTGSPLMNLPWTYLGVPAVSVPAGFNQSGLPFGLQVAGNFYDDEHLVVSAGGIAKHLMI